MSTKLSFKLFPTKPQEELLVKTLNEYTSTVNSLTDGYIRQGITRIKMISSKEITAEIPSLCKSMVSINVNSNLSEYKKLGTFASRNILCCCWRGDQIKFTDNKLVVPVIGSSGKIIYLTLDTDTQFKDEYAIVNLKISQIGDSFIATITAKEKSVEKEPKNSSGTKKNQAVTYWPRDNYDQIMEMRDRIKPVPFAIHVQNMLSKQIFVIQTIEKHEYTANDTSSANRIEHVLKTISVPYERDDLKFIGNLSESDFAKIERLY